MHKFWRGFLAKMAKRGTIGGVNISLSRKPNRAHKTPRRSAADFFAGKNPVKKSCEKIRGGAGGPPQAIGQDRRRKSPGKCRARRAGIGGGEDRRRAASGDGTGGGGNASGPAAEMHASRGEGFYARGSRSLPGLSSPPYSPPISHASGQGRPCKKASRTAADRPAAQASASQQADSASAAGQPYTASEEHTRPALHPRQRPTTKQRARINPGAPARDFEPHANQDRARGP